MSSSIRDRGWVRTRGCRPSLRMIQIAACSTLRLVERARAVQEGDLPRVGRDRGVAVVGALREGSAGRAGRGERDRRAAARADGEDLAEVDAALERDEGAVGGVVGEVVARAGRRGGELPLVAAAWIDREDRAARAVGAEIALERDPAVATGRGRARRLCEHGERETGRDEHGECAGAAWSGHADLFPRGWSRPPSRRVLTVRSQQAGAYVAAGQRAPPFGARQPAAGHRAGLALPGRRAHVPAVAAAVGEDREDVSRRRA